jgi:hypothetical protein
MRHFKFSLFIVTERFLRSLTYNIEYRRAVSKHLALEATFELQVQC